MVNAIIICWSKTGNTGKAVLTIKEILDEADANVESMKVEDAEDNEEIIRRDR
ncbi:MAG: hypothetical protein KAH06_03885 [Desulfobacterales bacterium]|nr:hypothetical protein [Desulfobacterales bacterium]